jgi:hypothetical protein
MCNIIVGAEREAMSFIAPDRFRPERRWSRGGTEPALAEIMADPIVHLVMRRDGVTESQLLRVVAVAQAVLRSRLCCCWAA